MEKTKEFNMSYIVNKFNDGEVVVKGNVFGWEFNEGFDGNYEHRPLMEDAMGELFNAGLATAKDVVETRKAREINDRRNLEAYFESQANRTAEQIAEERFEMQAAFGKGEKVVNILTGEVTYL
jgi:hypothetical protein